MRYLNEDEEVLLDMSTGYLHKLHTSKDKIKTIEKAIAILTKIKESLTNNIK